MRRGSTRRGRRGAAELLAVVAAAAGSAVGQQVASPDGGVSASVGQDAEGGCVERIASGKTRPKLTEQFPKTGLSGHAATLTVEVGHGKGETVLPGGFRLESDAQGEKLLQNAGFFLPDPDGAAGPVITRTETADSALTKVQISFVPLPEKPGRHALVLPSIPIAIAHASGQLSTLCTKSHALSVEDPIANEPDPNPRENPAPRPQREEWTLAKHVTWATLLALLVGALSAWLISKWLRRPRPAPPPPPPRPPWEVALEALFDVRNAGLIREQRFAEHYDRVSDVVRKYLGDLYGFDGLECTTRETLSVLRSVRMPGNVFSDIEAFMRQADLVKFARLTPSEAECEAALARAESIVQATIPEPSPPGDDEDPSPGARVTGDSQPPDRPSSPGAAL